MTKVFYSDDYGNPAFSVQKQISFFEENHSDLIAITLSSSVYSSVLVVIIIYHKKPIVTYPRVD